MVDKWINVIRYGALGLLFLLIYMLVLRPIKRQIVTTFQELPKQLGMARAAQEALPTGKHNLHAAKTDDTASLEASLSQLGDTPTGSKAGRPVEEEPAGKGQEGAGGGKSIDSELDAAGR